MKKEGFTIIELLLYLAILGSCLVMLSSFVNMVNAARTKNAVIAEVEQQGYEIGHIIRQSIMGSDGIDYPSIGDSSDTLSLFYSDYLKDPTTFSIDNGRVVITEGYGDPIPLNNGLVNASNMMFYNLGKSGTSGNITARFTLSSGTLIGRSEFSYSKTFEISASRRY